MAESGEYDYNTLLRRQKIAEQMLAESSKPQKIEHWAQGLAQLGNIGADTYRLNRLERQALEERKQDAAAMGDIVDRATGVRSTPAAIPASAPAAQPAPIVAGAPATEDYGSGIAGIESSGKYDALGPIIPKTGDRAYGKYQVIKTGESALSGQKLTLVESMTPQEFAANPEAQEAVFKGQFGNYTQKYGPEGAARAWFAGEGGMNDMGRKDPLGTSVADYSRKFTGGGMPKVAAAMAPQAVAATATGQPAAPDAQGDYGPDALLLPPGERAPRAAVAQAMAPTAAPAAPPPAAGPSAVAQAMSGRPGDIPATRAADIKRLISRTPGSPAHTMGMALLQKSIAGEKEDVQPMTEAQRAQWQVPAGMSAGIDRNTGKPVFSPPQTNVAVNSVADPVREGIGKSIVEGRNKALTASREVIPAMHDARTALDQGIFTGSAGDIKLALQKVGGVFGLPTKEAENTEIFRAQIGKQVLAHIKALGPNPSNADREFINSIEGGKGTLEEGTLRRLLDLGEKYARLAIKNHNTDADKLMKVQPDAYKGIGPVMMVDEPGEYAAPKKAVPSGSTSPSVDDLLKKYQ